MVTALYAGIFALIQVFLTFRVIAKRMHHNISIGYGDNEDLLRHIRAHGNFVETIPMALFMMFLLETSGLEFTFLHVLGGTLLASRVLHVVGVVTGGDRLMPCRKAGMVLMMLAYLAGAVLCLMMGLPTTTSLLPIQDG